MKKIIKITAIIIIILLIASGAYFVPKLIKQKQKVKVEKAKNNNEVFVNRTLQEFSLNPFAKASDIAQKVFDELNEVSINPYDTKQKAYTFQQDCKSCTSVEYDDNLTMVIVTTYDKQGSIQIRTVVKPPSFVTYEK